MSVNCETRLLRVKKDQVNKQRLCRTHGPLRHDKESGLGLDKF